MALEDKHKPCLRALQAQPNKRVMKAESRAGAESHKYTLSEINYIKHFVEY